MHLLWRQAFRHLYVLATEARWIQTVDVDTGLPVYVPLEITNKETELYSETSFCEITPCSLPERAIVSLSSHLPMQNHIPLLSLSLVNMYTCIQVYKHHLPDLRSCYLDTDLIVFYCINY